MTVRTGVLGLSLGLFLTGCGAPPPQVQPPEPPTVTVAKPIRKMSQPWLEFVGRAESFETVNLKADVTGKVTKVLFRPANGPEKGAAADQLREGGLVKKGELLFVIDEVPYKAALDQALAQKTGAVDRLKLAEANLKRVTNAGGNATEVSNATQTRDDAKNQLAEYEGKVAFAADQLKKCRITAPISGKISRALVTEGNTVTANVTELTRIIAVDPIYAVWDVDEASSLFYRRLIFDEKVLPNPRDTPLKCRIKLKNDTEYKRNGFVDYIDPEISRGSAARPIRGVFENANGYMTPGDSVRVQVEAGPSREVILIPPSAVSSQQSQKYVFVVVPGEKDGQLAQIRNVELGEITEGMQVVAKGLTENDVIVVNGLVRVRPGGPVKPVFEGGKSLAK